MHFIDFGLAQMNPMAALLEGLGGSYQGDFSHPSFGDTQMNSPERWASFGSVQEDGSQAELPYAAFLGPRGGMLPDDIVKTLGENTGRIRQKLLEKLGPEAEEFLNNFMQGAIGQTNQTLHNYQEALGLNGELENDGYGLTEDGHNEIMAFIDMLYNGISFAPGERKALEAAKKRRSGGQHKQNNKYGQMMMQIAQIKIYDRM